MYNYSISNVAKKAAKSHYSTSIPSVTGILGLTKLNYDTWLEKVEADFDFEAEKKKILKNSAVTKALSRGRKIASALDSGDDIKDDYLSTILQVSRDMMSDLEIVEKEAPLNFKDIYWGKADCVARKDDELLIIDNKCINKPLPVGRDGSPRPSSYKSYALQVTAYAKAHNEMFNTEIDTGLLYFVCSTGKDDITTNIIEIDVNEYWDEWQYRVRDYYQRQTILKQRELKFTTRRLNF